MQPKHAMMTINYEKTTNENSLQSCSIHCGQLNATMLLYACRIVLKETTCRATTKSELEKETKSMLIKSLAVF